MLKLTNANVLQVEVLSLIRRLLFHQWLHAVLCGLLTHYGVWLDWKLLWHWFRSCVVWTALFGGSVHSATSQARPKAACCLKLLFKAVSCLMWHDSRITYEEIALPCWPIQHNILCISLFYVKLFVQAYI